jgi:AAHS family 4-hydroxybenzoate transporter-like MFS transporter
VTSESNETADVGSIIDQNAWSSYQKFVLALASIAFIVDALANQVMAISIPAMIRDWHVLRAAFSPIVALGWVGVAIGTILAGSLADRFGRKPMLLFSIFLFGIATASCALVTDLQGLLVLRMIDGIGIGGAIPTATTLIAEFTPARRRSRAVNIGLISIPLGNFLCGAIGTIILPQFGWRTLFVANGGIAIGAGVLLLCILPESPQFLVHQINRREEFLRGVRRMNINVSTGTEWVDSNARRLKGPFTSLFSSGMARTTLALWSGFFFCFLAVYTSLNWMPTLLSSHGFGLSTTSLALAMAGIGGMLGSLFIAKLTELFGSRKSLILVTLGLGLGVWGLIALGLNPRHNTALLMVVLAWLSMCLNGLTGSIYALAAFVYPSFAKGTGLGAAGSVGRLGAITSSYAAVFVMALGSSAYFGFIGAAGFVAVCCLMGIRKHIPNDKGFDQGAAVKQ